MIYVVMGVSGCGKSTVSAALAAAWGLPFFDADAFHPAANKAKMAAGQALTDDDRGPWLSAMADCFAGWEASGGAVLACSALKRAYRDRLRAGGACGFIQLVAPRAVLADRLGARTDHFFNPALLDSQLATLEPPPSGPGDAAVVVSVEGGVAQVVAEVRALLGR